MFGWSSPRRYLLLAGAMSLLVAAMCLVSATTYYARLVMTGDDFTFEANLGFYWVTQCQNGDCQTVRARTIWKSLFQGPCKHKDAVFVIAAIMPLIASALSLVAGIVSVLPTSRRVASRATAALLLDCASLLAIVGATVCVDIVYYDKGCNNAPSISSIDGSRVGPTIVLNYLSLVIGTILLFVARRAISEAPLEGTEILIYHGSGGSGRIPGTHASYSSDIGISSYLAADPAAKPQNMYAMNPNQLSFNKKQQQAHAAAYGSTLTISTEGSGNLGGAGGFQHGALMKQHSPVQVDLAYSPTDGRRSTAAAV